jgi:transitional endoplasmic reticulum ATPase
VKKGANGSYDQTPEVDWSSIDTQVKHQGKEIVLPGEPGEMDYDTAIETIARVRDQENQQFDVKEIVPGAPWDALVATYMAMQDIYGVVTQHSAKSFFGEIRPDFITVDIGPGPNEKIQVPMGIMMLPNWEEKVQIVLHPKGCLIAGVVRKKDRARLIEIKNRAIEIMKERSVYRGKAITVGINEQDNGLNLHVQPAFFDLAHVSESDIIHTRDTELMIRTNIFSPLKNTQACRDHKIPLKRGVLLSGRYGTGKSLTARVTAKVATDNGWTFINITRAQGLKAAIEFARNYQPAVIFAEDIDRNADRSEETVNDLVNTIDGVIGKNSEIMVVLTTNHLENIDQALLRPGRLDAVISIEEPDAETATRLVHHYAGNLLADTEDLAEVSQRLVGQIPATIREVVERSKLNMLMGAREYLTADDLLASVIAMKHHMDLLLPKTKPETPAEKLFAGVSSAVAMAIAMQGGDNEEVIETLANLEDRMRNGLRQINEGVQTAGMAATMAAVNTSNANQRNGRSNGSRH